MTHCPASPAMSASSSSSDSSNSSKKNRRFSLIRFFNNTTSSSRSHRNSTVPSYRHSMNPSSMESIEAEMLHERRKSVAAMTESSFRPMSLDLRPSAIRPMLSKKEAPQTQMTDKMRQFDELLQTRCSSTIRISLTPSLLQEPY
ncbi:hypothetical protein BGX31_009772 [Mortierella sp. GBA43]|nr:hypothetical protein BGX31_009772 [Mortierella sp. GBA43]